MAIRAKAPEDKGSIEAEVFDAMFEQGEDITEYLDFARAAPRIRTAPNQRRFSHLDGQCAGSRSK
jgi:hypothetical protein